eukprot:jgi/Tetstr1/444062/TSEL_003302.t1
MARSASPSWAWLLVSLVVLSPCFLVHILAVDKFELVWSELLESRKLFVSISLRKGPAPPCYEQRQEAVQAGRQLPLSGYTQADLDAIGALPHSDPNKCYVFPLDAARGKAGAVRAISGYSGMGTVSFRMVEVGVHFENLQLIEANEEHRQDLRKQLQLMHDLWPERLPDKVMQRAFDLGDAVGHDITQLTAELA